MAVTEPVLTGKDAQTVTEATTALKFIEQRLENFVTNGCTREQLQGELATGLIPVTNNLKAVAFPSGSGFVGWFRRLLGL